MSVSKELLDQANGQCELCQKTEGLSEYLVLPEEKATDRANIVICTTCLSSIQDDESDGHDVQHWRCLNDAIWSPISAVKVLSWRIIKRHSGTGWLHELGEMMYLEEDELAWAKSGFEDQENAVVHKDSNGQVLEAGDTVILIKDLKVKGANFTAKRGTAVRRISLVHDNPEQIEGRVEGQHIVILTQYVKKSKV